MDEFDFAVIGGGPAGASAARRLAQAGASVVLFERSPMPRHKPCGGALSVRAIAHLDFPLPPSVIDGEVWGARIHFGGQSGEARLDKRIGVLVTRSKFDQFLAAKAEEAGAHLAWREVKSVEIRPDSVSLRTADGEAVARCAIVCEGANRKLSLLVRPRDKPAHMGFCLEAEVPVARPDTFPHLDGIIDITFGFPGRGYGWVFHHGSYYSVGVGGMLDGFRRPHDILRGFCAEQGIGLDGVRVWGHFVPCGGVSRRTCADRLILAGDAAGWVDPFQGEGLPYAIRSGQLAAETALAAAARGDFSAHGLAGYERRCQAEFGRELRTAFFLSRVMHHWPSLYIWLLASDKDILAKYLRVAATDLSYRYFLRRVITKGPWRWLRSRFSKALERQELTP